MKILELFSGTGSVGKAFPNDEVISVDIDNRYKPTHLISIFDFDYKQYEHFDYIHASPPCQYFSVLQTSWYGRKKRVNGEMVLYNKEIHKKMVEDVSDKLVLRAIEIIEYFNPQFWTIENPYSPSILSLSTRPYMQNYNYTIGNYCMYDYPIKKPTIFFNNFNLRLKKCDKSHLHQTWEQFSCNGEGPTIYTRYVIPSLLCEYIKEQIYSLF